MFVKKSTEISNRIKTVKVSYTAAPAGGAAVDSYVKTNKKKKLVDTICDENIVN